MLVPPCVQIGQAARDGIVCSGLFLFREAARAHKPSILPSSPAPAVDSSLSLFGDSHVRSFVSPSQRVWRHRPGVPLPTCRRGVPTSASERTRIKKKKKIKNRGKNLPSKARQLITPPDSEPHRQNHDAQQCSAKLTGQETEVESSRVPGQPPPSPAVPEGPVADPESTPDAALAGPGPARDGTRDTRVIPRRVRAEAHVAYTRYTQYARCFGSSLQHHGGRPHGRTSNRAMRRPQGSSSRLGPKRHSRFWAWPEVVTRREKKIRKNKIKRRGRRTEAKQKKEVGRLTRSPRALDSVPNAVYLDQAHPATRERGDKTPWHPVSFFLFPASN